MSLEKQNRSKGMLIRVVVFAVFLAAALAGYWFFGDDLSLKSLADREAEFRRFQQEQPVLIYASAFVIYVVITGLSIPGAAVLTLAYGWFFGLLPGVLLVSFASTAGATLAFLLSRFLFHDAFQRRFGDRLAKFNDAWDRDGPFFLFTLRLIPTVPFFVINAVMGLTSITTLTFWWVSQVGMLPATFIYVYAGSSVPSLDVLAEEGVQAIFSPTQLTQIVIAFVLLGAFPLVVRYLFRFLTHKKPERLTDV
ncbi:TVP38/TMEM64 family protein [Rubinisphaera margarita]|uniref:TVP38/TMEM64 family protein n=1 Tax=Rubinisphaera margarita TaxID=2909586 RepID=UPI001EE7FB40|nr:TVP38/TMEM64 family protein [Rubinisphaera margarita]MCG6155925.1 TVP38/TMEM64 family protein [Rubinisphaera margarita]